MSTNRKLKNDELDLKLKKDIDTEKNEKISNEVSEEKIEVVRKYVRLEENTGEYLKLIYNRYKRIINLGILVAIVLVVYILLMISAAKNIEVNESIESVEAEGITSQQNSDINESTETTEDTYKSKEKTNGKVYITGEVQNPGVYDIKEGDRIENVITYAGGTTANANLDVINLSEIVEDEQHIVIPNANETSETINVGSSSSGTSSTKVNINTASLEELKSISGVGDTIATSIIQYREENGKFKDIEEIKNVAGVGEKSYEKMKDQITVK